MIRTLCLTAALVVGGFAAQALPVTYNFTPKITSVTTISGIPPTVQENPSSPLLGNTGSAVLNIDTDDIDSFGDYFATGSEFTMTLDLGAGPETFTGANAFLGGALFSFNRLNNLTDVFFEVVDDDIFTEVEDQIAGPRIVIFEATGFDTQTDTLNFEVQALPIPLPASALLLISGLGGLAVIRRRKPRT